MPSSVNKIPSQSSSKVYNRNNDINDNLSKASSQSSAPIYIKLVKTKIQSTEERKHSNLNAGVLKAISDFLSRVFKATKKIKIIKIFIKACRGLASYIKRFVKKDKNDLQAIHINSTPLTQPNNTSNQYSHSNASPLTDDIPNNLKVELDQFIRINNASLPDKTIDKDNRQQIGGKGMHLEMIQQLKLPVPSFTCIPIDITTDIFNTQIPKNQLQQLIAHNLEFNNLSSLLYSESTSFVSLFEIIKQISSLDNKDNQTGCINELKALMNMSHFASLYDNSQAHKAIDKIHAKFSKQLTDPNQKIIIRSSGQKEDDYGNSQAGSYDSIKMHTNDSVMPVVIQVLASAIKEDTIIKNDFAPMSLVMQEYIDCLYGGVAFSYSSLTNNTMQVETAFGSSSAAVSGCEKLSGNISKIALQRDESGQLQNISFMETAKLQLSASIETDEQHPSESQMKNLFSYIMALENKLQCPVDVEFCVDKYNKLWLLQVRPITHLSGAMTFNLKNNLDNKSQTLTQGSLCSEGLATGYLHLINEASKIDDIPDEAIIIAEKGYACMLEDSFLDRIGGLILIQGGANTHLAIQCRQKSIPFMIITNKDYKLVNDKTLVTLCCGNIQGQSSGYLFIGEQENCVEASGIPTHLSPDSFKLHACTKTQVFTDPGEWFTWMLRQNDHLLNYLEQDAIISKLLSSIGQTEWCMSSDRIPMFNLLQREIINFIQDMKSMAKTYQSQFNSNDNKYKEAQDILNHIETFSKEISSLLQNIETGFTQGSTSLIDMNGTCRKLNTLLIELTNPENSANCKSLHDAIYILHKLFVNNTKSIALIKKNKSKYTNMSIRKYMAIRESTYTEKNTPDKTKTTLSEINKNKTEYHHIIDDFSPESPLPLDFLLTLDKMNCNSKTHNFKDLIISSLELGQHKCTVAMALNAEHGKGIALKVNFSDNIGVNHHSYGKLKRILFAARTLQYNLGENTSLKFELVGDIIFLNLETTNIENMEKMIKGAKDIYTVMAILKDIDLDINSRILPGISLYPTFDDISAMISKKPTDEENEMREFLLLFCINQSINYDSNTEKNLIDVLDKDRELVEYSLALEKSIRNKEHLPEIPEHYNAKLKSRLQKYRILLYPIKSFAEKIVTKDVLEDPQNLIMIMKDHDCISEIKNAGAENTLKQIGAHPDLVMQCISAKSDIIPYIDLSVEQMKTAIEKAIQNESKYSDDMDFLSEKIATIIKDDRYKLLTNDSEFMRFLLANMGKLIEYASDDIKDNKELIIIAASSTSSLKWASKRLQDDYYTVMSIVSKNGLSLKYASDRLRNNTDLVFTAISNKGESLRYTSDRLKDDNKIVMAAVSQNGSFFQYASKRLKDDNNIVIAAASKNESSLQYASKRLKNDYNTIKAIVTINGYSLKYASNSLQNNYDIVLAAVSSAGRSLKYASDRLKNDYVIVMNAVSQDGVAFKYTSKNLQNNAKIANIALKHTPTIEIFKYTSDRLQHDTNFLLSLKENINLLYRLKNLFQKDKNYYDSYFGKNQHLEALLNS